MAGVDQANIDDSIKAKEVYLKSLDPTGEALDWQVAYSEVCQEIKAALNASNNLKDVSKALEEDGAHMLILRHLLAPPKSQDQFKLMCPPWSKSTENNSKPVKAKTAHTVELVFLEWLDKAVCPWVLEQRDPTDAELSIIIHRTSAMIAQQRVGTVKRTRLANEQEAAVVALLTAIGWTKLPSSLIDTRAAVAEKCFMHKTRFATATTAPQEVDIACGLGSSYVAAMECKVTNDATNSVKRVNDIIKKANAWREHWGSFVKTAALLQGVIKPSDVQRLTDAGVVVFWSHDLDKFGQWLSKSMRSLLS